MIGTIDMAYPSNNQTFSHLLPNQNVAETPSLVVRYPETGLDRLLITIYNLKTRLTLLLR